MHFKIFLVARLPHSETDILCLAGGGKTHHHRQQGLKISDLQGVQEMLLKHKGYPKNALSDFFSSPYS